jgi:hypothetical protein
MSAPGQEPRPLEMAQWAIPLADGRFEVDTSPQPNTITPLLGNEEFGAYMVQVAPGKALTLGGGDQIFFALAGSADSTIEYAGAEYALEPGECGLVEARRPVKLQAAELALVMFGVGDRRLSVGSAEDSDAMTKHHLCYK